MRTQSFSSFLAISILAGAAVWSGCSSDEGGGRTADNNTGTGATTGSGGGFGTGGGFGGTVQGKDFPAEPIFDTGVDPSVAGKFGAAPAGTGPCVFEPQDGAMMPRNWLRPRFRVAPAAGEDLFQITLTTSVMQNPLVAYTTNSAWAMPAEYWAGVAGKASGTPVTVDVTIRATLNAGGGVTESKTKFLIAPVEATGSMVYWGSNQSKDNVNSSKLVGFKVGQETTQDALTPLQVSEADIRDETYALKGAVTSEWSDPTGAQPGHVSCIGCHTSTPDGDSVSFNNGFPWAGVTASIEDGKAGQRPAYVTGMGARLLQMPFIGTTTYSKGYWGADKRIAIATTTAAEGTGPYGTATNLADSAHLIWIDLAATGDGNIGADSTAANAAIQAAKGIAWDYLDRTGDTKAATNPAWSNDGLTIAYTSAQRVAGSHVGGIIGSTTPKSPDGVRTDGTDADIYTVPFNDKAGGAATALAGAATPGVAEYYPDFSGDDKLIAFNRAGSTTGYIYYRPDAEINVIPAGGGTPTRIAANDPPLCSGEVSPGIINSWAKWSPSPSKSGDKTYYWLIFSSARSYPGQFQVPPDYYTPTSLDTRSSQLYLAAVVTDASGAVVETYPAVYVWNQDPTTSNLTPAWDEFQLPDIIR